MVSPPVTKSPSSDPQDGFSAGMAAYRSRNFVEATRQFDGASRGGDQNAALWAAKSVKDGNGGCTAAVPRFDAIAQRSGGSFVGNEATLEAARCQIALGQLDAARDKLARLASTSSHGAQAQQALNELNQVASKREAERAKAASGGGYARPAAAAPARAPAKPAATASKPASADDANKASGY
jgi:thioredoxin-like negative regulator of GroEL